MPKANPLFSKIQIKEPPRSMFDLSHENKLSCNMGELIPALVVETLPGDKFKIQADIFTRLKPMVAPMMHRVDVTMHYFFVPNRLVWDNPTDHDDSWEAFITGGKDGTLTPTKPYFSCSMDDADYEDGWYNVCQLADYMGINIQNRFLDADREGTSIDICYDAMPFRAYRKIFDDYYLDENLGAPLPESSGLSILQGGEIACGNSDSEFETLHQIMTRCWEKDYFTSALPWVQRGDPMAIPFTGAFDNSGTQYIRSTTNGQLITGAPSFGTGSDGQTVVRAFNLSSDQFVQDVDFSTAEVSMESALTNATLTASTYGKLDVSSTIQNVATIQDLRIASKIQRWMEAHGLSGARYNETILTDFFTKVPDYRLQRAEYLGGGVVPVMINEVLQTSESGTTPLGEMGGHGVSSGGDNGCYYYCQEHGFIFGILSILPKAAYMQGLSKMWTRFDRFDYAFPRLQGIGEQPVYRREVLFRGDNNSSILGYGDNEVFGYQSQNADYKFLLDEVHGDFKTTLSYWHMARKFSYESKATLNTGFVQFSEDQICNPFSTDLNNGDNHFLCDIWFNMQSSRYLPFWATPSLN